MGVVLAIDGGTESLRAAMFDIKGHCLGVAAATYGISFGPGGIAEQSPKDWSAALESAVTRVIRESGLEAGDVEALAVDTTCCTLLPVDADGRPLRDALMWMDVRASQEAAEITRTGDPFLQVNGNGRTPVQAEWMIPKALWLKRHEPDMYSQAATIYEYQDHLNYLLTGRATGSRSGMVGRWHYLPDRGGWPTSLYSAVGLDDLSEKLPQNILGPGDHVGDLVPDMAKALGLAPGTPVFQGGADAYLAVIGMGVAKPGEMALVTGTSHLMLAVTDTPFYHAGILGTFRDAVYQDRWIVDGGQTSSGASLAWMRRTCAEHLSFDELNAAAADVPIGSGGLVALDHLQGNRSPYSDPLARGAWVGLGLDHGIAHMYRAMMEAVCFGTRLIVDTYEQTIAVDRVVAGGGALKSPIWMQMHADTLGKTIEVPEFPDAPLLGCAVVAANGLGHHPDIDTAATRMVRIAARYDPDPDATSAYQAPYEKYTGLYHALRQWRDT